MICLDTQVTIYCIERQASQSTDLTERAAALLAQCDKQETPIMLPAIVVAELLCGVQPNYQSGYLSKLHQRFIVPPFDQQAAIMFSRLWIENRSRFKDLQSQGISRNRIKADWMIVASALARGAICIYSEDEAVHTCARGLIEVRYLRSVPIPPRQDSFL